MVGGVYGGFSADFLGGIASLQILRPESAEFKQYPVGVAVAEELALRPRMSKNLRGLRSSRISIALRGVYIGNGFCVGEALFQSKNRFPTVSEPGNLKDFSGNCRGGMAGGVNLLPVRQLGRRFLD